MLGLRALAYVENMQRWDRENSRQTCKHEKSPKLIEATNQSIRKKAEAFRTDLETFKQKFNPQNIPEIEEGEHQICVPKENDLRRLHEERTQATFTIQLGESFVEHTGRITNLAPAKKNGDPKSLIATIRKDDETEVLVVASNIVFVKELLETSATLLEEDFSVVNEDVLKKITPSPQELQALFEKKTQAIFTVTRKKIYGSNLKDLNNPRLQALVEKIRATPPKIIFEQLPVPGIITSIQTMGDVTRITILTPSGYRFECNSSEIDWITPL